MKNKLIQFREWIENSITSYKRGELMSMAESCHGEQVYSDVLKKFDETFNTSGKQTILVDDVLDSIISNMYNAFLRKKELQDCLSQAAPGYEDNIRRITFELTASKIAANSKIMMLDTLLKPTGAVRQIKFKTLCLDIPEELCVMMEERIKYHATKEG